MLKKFLSLILIICLCFTLVTVPMRTEANALVQVLPVVVGITGLIIVMMGLQFTCQADFRSAAHACAEAMPTELINAITTFVTFTGDVTSPTFGLKIASGLVEHWDDIYAFVKGYFGESGSVSIEHDAFDSYVKNPATNVCPIVVDSSDIKSDLGHYYVYFTDAQRAFIKGYNIPNGASFSFENTYNNITNNYFVKINEKGQVWFNNSKGTLYYTSSRGFLFALCYVRVNSAYCFGVITGYYEDSVFEVIKLSNVFVSIDGFTTTSTEDLPYSTAPGAVPPDAISDSFKDRLTSAGGISLVNEDSKVITEVFGDAATDTKAAEATQEDVLTETGAIENIDTIKYPSLKIFEAAGTYSGQPLELKDIFPFCIPFDLYDMVTGLQAARCAPYFEWELVVPNVIDYTFEIDFSSFDTVATLLRTLELLAFCVGLAFVTRSIIRG